MKLRLLVIAFALALVPATAAQAANYNTTLGGSTLKYEWDGGPGNSVIGDSSMDPVADCGPGHDCDYLLIKTDNAGSLTVAISGTSEGNVDTDIYLHESNAQGEKGKQMAEGVSFSPDDSVTGRVKAGGYYLAIMSYRTAIAATYHGVATLKPTATAAPGPGTTPPGGTPPASGGPAPKVTIAKIASKKVRRFRGTATDAAKVEVAVVKGKKKPAFKAAKGTSKWSLTLKKALKKGRYTLIVRATGANGQVTEAKKAFRVKR